MQFYKHKESRRKVTSSRKIAFGFESSLVKDYQIYLLNNGCDALNSLAVYVYQDNRIHTAHFRTLLVLMIVFIMALDNSWVLEYFREFTRV